MALREETSRSNLKRIITLETNLPITLEAIALKFPANFPEGDSYSSTTLQCRGEWTTATSCRSFQLNKMSLVES